MYQPQLDALVQFASQEAFKPALLAAKAEYFRHTGEVFEDDKSFEMRMACFLDYYVFDSLLPNFCKTPAQLFLERRSDLPAREWGILRGFTETRHSLFEVKKLAREVVRLRDLVAGKDVEVYERREPMGLSRGDLLEARLIPIEGRSLFSSAFCFHPAGAMKPTLKEIQRRKKTGAPSSLRELIWALSRMRLKVERYRNVAVADIYTFDRKTI